MRPVSGLELLTPLPKNCYVSAGNVQKLLCFSWERHAAHILNFLVGMGAKPCKKFRCPIPEIVLPMNESKSPCFALERRFFRVRCHNETVFVTDRQLDRVMELAIVIANALIMQWLVTNSKRSVSNRELEICDWTPRISRPPMGLYLGSEFPRFSPVFNNFHRFCAVGAV